MRAGVWRLRPDLAERWRTLFVFPASFDLRAAAAVWDVSKDEADGPLLAIEKWELLNRDNQTGRFAIHPFLRELPPSAPDIIGTAENGPHAAGGTYELAVRRHAIHYASLVVDLANSYSSRRLPYESALHRFDLEWPNIEAGHAWAAAHAGAAIEAAWMCIVYTVSAMPFLSVRRSPADIEQWLDSRATWWDRSTTPCAAIALNYLGSAYGELGRRDTEAACYLEALRRVEEIREPQLEAEIRIKLASAYADSGSIEEAINLYQIALRSVQNSGDHSTEARYLAELGRLVCPVGQERKRTGGFAKGGGSFSDDGRQSGPRDRAAIDG